VGALEIEEGLVSDLLTVIADSELRSPGANLAHSLFEFLDVAHIHLGDLSMNVNNPARFIEVVVRLPKD
jgi:hypothetical protein